ncbi:ATP-binding protein [Moraxella catarrhalis]|uniref:AAA family ATPase n=1 Tax=Moraxella catarrhalis TaxID=480 RepID=UPI0007E427DC|nr:AAA family ATPase [Moraxella catarrhalis]MPW64978.1 hypothetical protein [Moraxella catarrhalis]MPW90314.1 hypothetical protein [Moraxella catarrhalis]OAV14441.1 hypothetical protein AO376_1031 [Moraxella catarrhalis]OAV16229.1 hypothetical protein AO374_1716 [Moraxella catarrhalis]OBX43872.1 hypothetical protein A9Z57_04950 [Moraxella catarrhalis]
MQDIWHYPRTELAQQVMGLFNSNLSHALTFFAPRRKGKTEFLLKDIKPLAIEQDYQVFYFSFLDSGEQAQKRFIYELTAFGQGKIGKAINQLSSVEIQGFKAELQHLQHDDVLHALNAIAKQNKRTLLLLDEIQALAGVAYYPIIASLRTALDTNKDKIKVIFTGSSRENLRLMFSSAQAPFFHYGQNVDFPDLPKAFTDHLADTFYHTTKRQLDKDALWQAFIELNKSPQMARAMIEKMALNPNLSLDDAKQLLIDDTAQFNEYLPTYRQLTALQQAVLVLIAMGENQPYSQATKDRLGKKLGIEITTPAIQSAIRSLSKKGLIFKKDNGVYEIDDPFFNQWVLDN